MFDTVAPFLAKNPGYLVNPVATDRCEYCPYSVGSEFLAARKLGFAVLCDFHLALDD